MSVWCGRERYFPKKIASRLDESEIEKTKPCKYNGFGAPIVLTLERYVRFLIQISISLVSKAVFKFEKKSSNLTMSISLCPSAVLHGCGGLREAVSIHRIPQDVGGV